MGFPPLTLQGQEKRSGLVHQSLHHQPFSPRSFHIRNLSWGDQGCAGRQGCPCSSATVIENRKTGDKRAVQREGTGSVSRREPTAGHVPSRECSYIKSPRHLNGKRGHTQHNYPIYVREGNMKTRMRRRISTNMVTMMFSG